MKREQDGMGKKSKMVDLQSDYARRYNISNTKSFLDKKTSQEDSIEFNQKVRFAQPLPLDTSPTRKDEVRFEPKTLAIDDDEEVPLRIRDYHTPFTAKNSTKKLMDFHSTQQDKDRIDDL